MIKVTLNYSHSQDELVTRAVWGIARRVAGVVAGQDDIAGPAPYFTGNGKFFCDRSHNWLLETRTHGQEVRVYIEHVGQQNDQEAAVAAALVAFGAGSYAVEVIPHAVPA